MNPYRNPILVALDMPTAEQAVRLAREIEPHVGGFKIGLELLMGPGPGVIAAIAKLGKPVFADAKLHDIPNTVRYAARQLGLAGARWVTAHAAGGEVMLRAAAAGLADGSGARDAGILAITVLTSLDDDTLAPTGVTLSPGKLTAKRARLADAAGCEGVVSSVKELGVIAEVAPGLVRITPGIRPQGFASDDHARVATPEEALARGADYLVIGRPITKAAEPSAAAAAILAGIDKVPD